MVLARRYLGGFILKYFQGLKIFTAVWSIKLLLNFDTNPLGPGKNAGEPEEPTNSQFGSAQTLLFVIPWNTAWLRTEFPSQSIDDDNPQCNVILRVVEPQN